MKFAKIVALSAFIGALVFAAAPSMAVPPPPPPGVHLMPGMVWCPRCGGHGRVPSGFLGWHDKRCPECRGAGMLQVRPVRPMPPPPAAHHPAPAPHHAKPAPQPMHNVKPMAPHQPARPVAPVKQVPPPPAHRR